MSMFLPDEYVKYGALFARIVKQINEKDKVDLAAQGPRYYIHCDGWYWSVPASSISKVKKRNKNNPPKT